MSQLSNIMSEHSILTCDYCHGGPKKGYKHGFKNSIIKSGKYELASESLGSLMGFLFSGSFEDVGFIRITHGKSYSSSKYSSYCSLSCLHKKYPLNHLVENMREEDRDSILEYFPLKMDSVPVRMLTDVTVLKEEIEIQKEIIRNIHESEERLKQSIERRKQKEIDALLETLKARDKEIFYLTTQLMELKNNL